MKIGSILAKFSGSLLEEVRKKGCVASGGNIGKRMSILVMMIFNHKRRRSFEALVLKHRNCGGTLTQSNDIS